MVPDLNEDALVAGLDGVQFVVLLGIIAGPGRDFRQPAPGLAVVPRFAHPDPSLAGPQLHPGIKQTAIGELSRSVRAVHDRRVARGPGHASIGRADHPLAQFSAALFRSQTVMRRLPGIKALGRPSPRFPGLPCPCLLEGLLVGQRGERSHQD